MDRQVVERLPGSPQPQDPFEPHMPAADRLVDMGGFFTELRRRLASGEPISEATRPGERELALVMAPGREIMIQPVARPTDPELVQGARRMFQARGDLQVTAISLTDYEAFAADETMTKCVPFLGVLMGLAFVGHRVVVFEGHPAALEAGVAGTEVLIVDSGMEPFLQSDWHAVATSVVAPGVRVYLHDREDYGIRPVVANARAERGWRVTEPDDEGSYVNGLLSALALGPTSQVTLRLDQPLPDLGEITGRAAEAAWIWETPFAYDLLDRDVVMGILETNSHRSFFSRTRKLEAMLVSADKPFKARFEIVEGRSPDGVRSMQVKRA